ncbi:MAG: DUF5011 domain-containing protein [Bacilli bacterium]|nr:DUF5011 domain-containing protein [Bacilli bacterium]
MKKKYCMVIFVLSLFIFPFGVDALTSSEIAGRNVCGSYEVAIAIEKRAGDPSSTSFQHVNCYGSYNEAVNAMNSNSNRDTVVLERRNGVTKIVNAKYALVDLTLKGNSVVYYYPTASSSSYNNYMVTSSSTGAVDGAFLDFDLSTRRAKVKVAGYTGWVGEGAYNIVPIVWVYSIGYYRSTNNEFKHFFAKNITNTGGSGYGIAISRLPSGLSNGVNYFSYDGHYFYTDQYKMVGDYKNGNYNNAANMNNPFYNYYQYLPNHSKTNYSAANINKYIREGLGFTHTVFGNTLNIKGSFDTSVVSKLYGMGTYFIYAQEQYGANAILSLGLNRNESGDGRSSISILKNNGFGEGAVDSSPFGSAYGFITYQGGIYSHAQHFVTDLYENANHSYYNGGHYGNKLGGWNVKYASDPLWGEKNASYYYRFDKYNGFQDYNFYQLAINTTSVVARSSASNNSKAVYTLPNKEIPVIILEEVTGDNVGGSNKWYKIVSDMNLDYNKNSYSFYAEKFDWDNSYVYVPSVYFKKINTAVNGIKSINDVFPHQGSTYKYSFYNDGVNLTPKVGKTIRKTDYYYDGGLTEKTGKSVLQDKYVMVYDRAVDSNNNTVSYLITSDYKYDQKEWVSANDVNIVGGMYGKQSVVPVGYGSNVFSTAASSTIISALYDGCYVPVLEEVKGQGNKTYLKVPVSLDSTSNSYGYTLKTDDDAYITVYQDKENVVSNNTPIITAGDKEIIQGRSIDLKSLATATDKEDGNITSSIKVSGTVNINVVGKYTITYTVTDKGGLTATKKIVVTVIENAKPVINASDITIRENTSFDPKSGVAAVDKEDGNLTSKITVVSNNVDTNKIGKYSVVYKVVDSYNQAVTKAITVNVVSKDTVIETRSEKEGEFYLQDLVFDKAKQKYQISGYLIIKNVQNRVSDSINYQLVLKDINSDKSYTFDVDRWVKDVPFALGVENGYDYNGAWFKGYIDFSKDNLEGDYEVYMKAGTSTHYTLQKVTNIFNKDITRRSEDSKYGYNFKVELGSKQQEITLNIRKGGLITTSVSNTYRNMINNYDDMKFVDNKLNVVGTSYNYGVNYDNSNFVERKLVLENTTTFKQYTFDIASTSNGSYSVDIGDNKNKSLVWYNKTIDISSIDKGRYSMIVYTKTKDVADYGEISDVFGSINKAETVINNKKYHIELNKNRNNRIELIVE